MGKRLRRLLQTIFIASAVLSLTPLVQSWSWILEDLAAFRVLWATVAVLASVAAIVIRRRIVAALCLACAVINGLGLVEPEPSVAKSAGTSGAVLRILHHNVHTANEDKDAVREHIASARADVVVLIEVDGAWLKKLAPALREHPHSLARPRRDNFGIAVFSRLPARFEERNFGLEVGIEGTIEVGGRTVNIVAFHAMPPVWGALHRRRNEAIAALSSRLAARDGPTIVSGDFNATPWSPVMRRFRAETGLESTAVGFAAAPTWPALLPRFMRVPIDRVLVSSELEIIDLALGPRCGSDHLPLVVDVAVPKIDNGD